MEDKMQIAMIVLLSLILVSNLFILMKASRLNPSKFMELFTTQNAESVETAIITELIQYCETKGIHGVYFDTKGTTAGLSYEKDGETIRVVDLVFPMTKVGSSEYLSSLEYQKELIDNFCGGVKNA